MITGQPSKWEQLAAVQRKTSKPIKDLEEPNCDAEYKRIGLLVFKAISVNIGNGMISGPLPLSMSDLLALKRFYSLFLDDYQNDFMVDVQIIIVNNWRRTDGSDSTN